MVLMQATRNFATPNRAPTDFIEIAALANHNVAIHERKARHIFFSDNYSLHLSEIEMTILDIRYPEIRQFDSCHPCGICFPLCDAGLQKRDFT